MNPTQKEIYEKTVKRLARMGALDPTCQIISLAKEIERYRERIQYLEAKLRETAPLNPCEPSVSKPKDRYTYYDTELERFVVPCFHKLGGDQIGFYMLDRPDDVPKVWGDAIDSLAYYENQDKCERKDCESCGYKKKLEELMRQPSCNDCANSTTNACGVRPQWGESVRINCPLHKPKEEAKP